MESNMRVNVISRNPDDHLRATTRDIHKLPRNYDPSLHPFEAPREYTQALNAIKLERLFAKPYLANLDGHRDGVASLATHPSRLATLASGAFDGEVRLWDLCSRLCVRNFVAHEGWVRKVCFIPDGGRFITTGDDKTIKFWNSENPPFGVEEEPVATLLSQSVVMNLSHHRNLPLFVTSGAVCQLWEETRNEPIKTFEWGVDSLHHVSYNQVEQNIIAACASDRSIILYDCRDTGPLRKVVMEMQSNALAWNPMEAFMFTVANEDYNLYTFDTRKLSVPVTVHQDHTAAVIDLDYSPTGLQFATGSYDKTIRIYEKDKGHSRDVYHTQRMQRLTCIKYSLDDKYILSGSDEMNIRIWKSKAAEKLGVLKPREREALNHSEALKEKFASHPQVKRIAKHRHVPKHIYNAKKELAVLKMKAKRKEANRRAHCKPGSVPFVPERKKHVVKEEE